LLYLESIVESKTSKSPTFHRTGQLGDVMKESSTIAYSFAKGLLSRKVPSNKFFEKSSIHMHIPEGATPKDGPSAGCTMATSLISLALDRPVSPDISMTGELTLTGLILKIGGLKEKTIAAKRSGVKRVIFPASNKPDWEELEDYIKEGITPIFCETYEEIYAVVFPDTKEASADANWMTVGAGKTSNVVNSAEM
jgi:Lon-like ATP-dependent protease